MNQLIFKLVLIGLLAISNLSGAQVGHCAKIPTEALSTGMDTVEQSGQQLVSSLASDYNLPTQSLDQSAVADQPEPSRGSLASDYHLE